MGAKANLLTDNKIKGLKCEPGKQFKKIAVGGVDNLYLFIYPDTKNGLKGGRVFRYFYEKNKSETIGKYPDLALAEARDKARVFTQEKAVKEAIRDTITLEDAVDKFINFKKNDLAEKTLSKELLRVKNYLYPTLKDKNIKEIIKKDILTPLKAINEAQGVAESVIRCKNFVSRIFDYMVGLDLLEDNVVRLIPNDIFTKPKERHFPALTDETRIKDFIQAINNTDNKTSINTKHALIFSILTGSRPGNIRLIKWDEIDFKKGTWSVQAEKMKSRRVHTIGLSRQAIEVLKFQKLFSSNEYIFGDNGLSENTVNKFIHRLGFKGEMSAHGVRAMFKTICKNHKKEDDIVERCMAHAIKDRLQKAYDRSENTPEMIEHKRELLQWYADYLDSIEPIRIVDIHNLNTLN